MKILCVKTDSLTARPFTGDGACRPRPRWKSEMNFCSTVICSLFRLPFVPVPVSIGVRLCRKPEMNFCSRFESE